MVLDNSFCELLDVFVIRLFHGHFGQFNLSLIGFTQFLHDCFFKRLTFLGVATSIGRAMTSPCQLGTNWLSTRRTSVRFFRHDKDSIGTFEHFTYKFDHLKNLGINALQIMPIAEFASDLSWGYNPAHPYAIESAYGGAIGFKNFVRKAHQAGFAVILDVIYNHFGPSDLDL